MLLLSKMRWLNSPVYFTSALRHREKWTSEWEKSCLTLVALLPPAVYWHLLGFDTVNYLSPHTVGLTVLLLPCLPVCLPTWLSVCWFACMPAYISSPVPVCLPMPGCFSMPTCLSACLPACLHLCTCLSMPTYPANPTTYNLRTGQNVVDWLWND